MNILLLSVLVALIGAIAYLIAKNSKKGLRSLSVDQLKTPKQIAFENMANAVLVLMIAFIGADIKEHGVELINAVSNAIPTIIELCIVAIGLFTKLKTKYA